MDSTANLEALLVRGPDTALLRLTLATRYLAANDLARALVHAEAAVALDADYSAAWKLLGKIQAAQGRAPEAAATYRRGIEVAQRRGDLQAAKEMQVFLRRLERPGEDRG